MAAREARDMRITLNDADHHPGTWAATSEAIERGEGITRTKARSKRCPSDNLPGDPTIRPTVPTEVGEDNARFDPTGEPDEAKVSRPVRRGAAETGPHGNRADRPPYVGRHERPDGMRQDRSSQIV